MAILTEDGELIRWQCSSSAHGRRRCGISTADRRTELYRHRHTKPKRTG
jgi:hypothetical protein